MKQSLCTIPSCTNYQRYCRLHIGYTVPVVSKPAKVSENKKEADKKYRKVRSQYLKAHPFCEAKIEGCKTVATEIHHKKGKASEELYLDPKHFLSVCFHCHQIIEKNPAFAKQQGFSISRLSKV